MLNLAERLDVNPEHALPGYEDAWYYLWKERRLPVNVDPFENKLENAGRPRAPGARVRTRAWTKSSATPCPCGANTIPMARSEWVSGAWFFRPERMYLVPGDSPMGFRLPLDSIPWVKESEVPAHHRARPDGGSRRIAERAALSGRQRYADEARRISARRRDSWSKSWNRRSARARPRRRTLVLDLPPAPGPIGAAGSFARRCARKRATASCACSCRRNNTLEDYLGLVAAIEDTAADLGMPVLVEGYAPPHDSRVHTIKVTPDPGVIEVNLHPSASWDELVKNTTALYEEARLSRLGTEKFMLDGRHTGTGGGNHILVGGASPGRFAAAAQSRIAAQPDRLLAQPSRAFVPVQRNFCRPHQPGAAHRRSAQRSGLRNGNRVPADSGSWRRSAVDGGPHLPKLAGRRHGQHAPRRILHRQALLARHAPRAAWACWKCAPLKCRRIRG